MDTTPLITVQGAVLQAKPTPDPASTDTNARFTTDDTAPVDPTLLPAPIKGLGIAPLDMFAVGDNDDVPLPPEPPRDLATQVEPWQPVAEDAEAPHTASDDTDAPQHLQPDLARAVQALDGEEVTPTVDIRR